MENYAPKDSPCGYLHEELCVDTGLVDQCECIPGVPRRACTRNLRGKILTKGDIKKFQEDRVSREKVPESAKLVDPCELAVVARRDEFHRAKPPYRGSNIAVKFPRFVVKFPKAKPDGGDAIESFRESRT